MEHQLTERPPPPRFSSASAIKEVFDPQNTKSDEKGKSRAGKERAKDVDEGHQAGGAAEESSGKAGSSKGLVGIIADEKTISELRDEITFVDSNVKETYKSTGTGSPRKDWLLYWSRGRHLIHDPARPMRIVDILNFHTQDWSNLNPKSVSRLRKDVIAAAITEYCAVAKYREELLDDTFGGFAYVRAMLERSVASVIKDGEGVPCHPSENFVTPDGRTKSPRTLTWPDKIKFDSHLSVGQFDFSDHQSRIMRESVIREQTEMVQHVVSSVMKCELAWKTPHADKKKLHPLQQEVHDALQQLVDVCVSRSRLIAYTESFYSETRLECIRHPRT